MRRAIVATVRNEERRIEEFLTSLERQTVRPDVVVITDGGSTDRTPEILQAFAARASIPFEWAAVPGNRSRGRNEAIRRAHSDIIAMTDASVLDPEWFARIIAPLEDGTADLVSGWYDLLTEGPREQCVGLLTQFSRDQVSRTGFLPSSRSVAFRHDLWERAGGYPEAFSGNEDTIFDLAVERLRPRNAFASQAVVHWRPAASLREVYRQYRKYAVGDGQAAIFLTTETRYAAIYAAYGGGVVLLFAGLIWWPLWMILAIGAVGYGAFRVRKVIRARLWSQIPYAILVVLAWDMSRIIGYMAGRIDRIRNGAEYFRF